MHQSAIYRTMHVPDTGVPYMWTLPDHPGASRKCGPTPALPGVRQNLSDARMWKYKKKKNFFFFFFFQTIIFAHMYGNNGHLLLEGN